MMELQRTHISHLRRCDVIFNILIFDILINHLTHTISALTLGIYIYIYSQNKIYDFYTWNTAVDLLLTFINMFFSSMFFSHHREYASQSIKTI